MVEIALSTTSVGDLERLAVSWRRHLVATNKAPKTIKSYTLSLALLRGYLADHGLPTTAHDLTREHVELFVADQVTPWKPKTAQIRYGDLQQFFTWALDEREIASSPMANMGRPKVPEQPVPVLTLDEIHALLKACDGTAFEQRRDTAIVWLFYDTGLRVEEPTRLTVADVDFDLGVVQVVRKGRKEGTVPFGQKVSQSPRSLPAGP